MANYKPDLSCQNKFIPIDFSHQIVPGTFEYALAHIVENHLDLSGFDTLYRNDKTGAAAYPPSVMLKVILFAYSRGIISSRKIAQACETNITFMSLSGDVQPHYTCIAGFVARMKDQIEPLFTQVLMICDEQGLIGRNMFAIDGCKIKSNASKEWSGTFDELGRKEVKLRKASQRILERHQAQDNANEDELAHDIKQKEKLDNSANKIREYLAIHHEKRGSKGKPVKSNITDPDSAKMTTSKGTIQGYNGIAINDDKHQIILQAQTWGSVGEQQTLKPAIEQLENQLNQLGTPDTINKAKFTADSGFHSEANLEYMAATGLDAYIADNAFRSRNPLFKTSETYQTEQTCQCPAGKSLWRQSSVIISKGKEYVRFTGYLKDCRVCPLQRQCMRNKPKSTGRQVQFLKEGNDQISFCDRMKVKIDSPAGRRQYSKRLGCIEPVFGNICVNKGMNKFTLRGQDKVNSQWQMYCLVHNIEKLRYSLS